MENCIVETLLMTSNLDGSPNIAPMGITRHGNHLIVKAYKTSQTYENLKRGDSVSIYVSSDPLLFLKTAFKQEFDPQPELDKADSVIQVETIGQVYEDALRRRSNSNQQALRSNPPFQKYSAGEELRQ